MCASAAGYFKITNRTLHTLKKPRHFKTAFAPEQKFLPTGTVPGIERGIVNTIVNTGKKPVKI